MNDAPAVGRVFQHHRLSAQKRHRLAVLGRMQFALCSHPSKLAFGAGRAMDQLDMSGFQELGIVSGMAAQVFLTRPLGTPAFKDQHILGQ